MHIVSAHHVSTQHCLTEPFTFHIYCLPLLTALLFALSPFGKCFLPSNLESYLARFMSENIRLTIHTALIYPLFFISMKIGLLLCGKTLYSTCLRMSS